MRKGKVELLAPAGSYDAMVAAIQAGADAIYLGGVQFGARAFATNFNRDELKKAVEYCHLHQVLLYVTVNILYQNDQFDELLEYINYLYSINVDALIVQDMGLYHYLKKYFNDFEIHISTQASVRNRAGVEFFQQQHIDRVVIARETSITEIEDICKNTDIDIEVFVHGAICMSYSGQCLMSSMIARRSGNQGSCGQPCRLQYDFLKNNKIESNENKYLLSPKDLCSIEHVPRLIEAGVKSFKVEGRMKKPEYVASVVSSYRKAIDTYYKNESFDVLEAKASMKKIFNRGFTGGFLWQDTDFVSVDIPGNRGVKTAKIIRYNKRDKKLVLRLIDTVHQNDRLYFPKDELTRTVTKIYKNHLLVNEAFKDDIIEIELNKMIDLSQGVYKISDYLYEKELQKYIQQENISLPIKMKLSGTIGRPIELSVYDDATQICCKSSIMIEKAIKTPLAKERIEKQLSKLGNTIYHLKNVDIDFPNDGTISIKCINDLRREAIDLFQHEKLNIRRDKVELSQEHFFQATRDKKDLDVMVLNMKQYKSLDFKKIRYAFVPFYLINQINILNRKIIPYIPYLYSNEALDEFIKSDNFNQFDTIMVSDYGALHLLQDQKKIILNYNFNLCNDFGINELNHDIVLPYEMSEKQINHLHTKNKLFFIAYGKTINMNMKHCIISQFYLGKKTMNCYLCRQGKYQLKDRKGELFDIVTDPFCNNYILHYKTLDCQKIANLNVDSIVLNFTNENGSKVNEVVNRYYNIINGFVEDSPNSNKYTGYF